jgi:hypothetical protein
MFKIRFKMSLNDAKYQRKVISYVMLCYVMLCYVMDPVNGLRLTLDSKYHSLADRWRYSIGRDAQVRPHV